MKKVILNKCYGGFSVSKAAYELYAKKIGASLYCYEWEPDNLYVRTYKNNGFIDYFTKDFGNRAYISDEDYKKYNLYLDDSYREDKILIEVVEKLGKLANTEYSDLKIVEIPNDLDYVIDDYDGIETLHQKVQEW